MQNDIIGIYDSNNTLVARYEYDAWGNHKVYDQNGNLNTTSYFIGNVNSFIYRSYYYDRETNLYYCYARYYNPELCRWMSLDSLEYLDHETLNGMNLYAYCNNNPINSSDPNGNFPFLACLSGVVLSGLITGVSAMVSKQEDESNLGAFVGGFIDGAVGSAAIAAGLASGSPLLAVGIGAVGGAIGNAVGQKISYGDVQIAPVLIQVYIVE